MIQALLAAVAVFPVPNSFTRPVLPAHDDPKPQSEKPAPIYDEKADAKSDIAAAVAHAKKENHRVLVQWGANWCGWCHRLHELFHADKDLAKELLYEYDVVLVDIGKWDKNMELATSYGADLKQSGVPYLTLLDGDGKVLLNQDSGFFETKDEARPGHDPKKVLEFLKGHQAPYAKAQDLYDAALARAKAEDRRVFLHFGAPWCVWCRRLEAWMASADVAPILSKAFIDLKIDTERTIGGSEMLTATLARGSAAKSGAKPGGGIPWFAFLDSSGSLLADSDAAKGNVGFPSDPAEIEHFLAMLAKSGAKLSAAEVDQLKRTLDADREKREAAAKKKAG
jgi:thiol-disulfide isomerase/thioredoxin